MKYFNRKSFAVEQLFSNYLKYYLYDNGNGNYITVNIDKKINITIDKDSIDSLFQLFREIISDKYDMVSFIPENIVDIINDSNMEYNIDEIAIVLKWVEECCYSNYESSLKWKSSIDKVLIDLKWNKYKYFENIRDDIFPMKVRISREDSTTIKIEPVFSSWGTFNFQFLNSAIDIDMEFESIEGWLLWSEVDKIQQQYEFSFLLYAVEKNQFVLKNLIKDSNWLELKVICKIPKLYINYHDYAHRWLETGCHSTKIFLEACKAMLIKEQDLGGLYFNEKERQMLLLAQLYFCLSPVLNHRDEEKNPIHADKLDLFIGNRYGFEQACKIIKEAGDEKLFNALNSLKMALDDKEISECSSECNKIWRILKNRDNNKIGRKLYHNLSKKMLYASNTYEKAWNGRTEFLSIKEAIIREIQPSLLQIGFSGQFPHYRRILKNKGHYITFVIESDSIEKSYKNNYCISTYKVSLVVAAADRLRKIKDEYMLSDLSFDNTDAWDCLWDRFKCRLTTIGPSDAEGRFSIKVRSNNQTIDWVSVDRQVKKILPYVEVIQCLFTNKALPEFYIKHHRELLKKRKTVKALNRIIGMGGFIFALVMWIVFNIIFPIIEKGTLPEKLFNLSSILLYLGFGSIWSLVFGIFAFFSIRHKVWTS